MGRTGPVRIGAFHWRSCCGRTEEPGLSIRQFGGRPTMRGGHLGGSTFLQFGHVPVVPRGQGRTIGLQFG